MQEFGDKRVVDTPITEQGFAGLGVGAGFAGLKPIVEFMTWNFAMQAMTRSSTPLLKDALYVGRADGLPYRVPRPQRRGARVAAQHSQCYASWYAHVPGLKVVAPYDRRRPQGLAQSGDPRPNPVVFLEHELMYGKSFDVPKIPNLSCRSARHASPAPASI